nr:TonB-dependent receptor [candidate division Zixibacteria bacterium]
MRPVSLLITAFMLLLFNNINAITIGGRVLDRDRNPIEGVTVQTEQTAFITQTDKSGHFEINTGDKTTASLTFSHIGYQPSMISLKKAKDLTDLEIILDYAIYPGQKIRVTAMRAITGLTPVAFADFTPDEIKRDYTVEDFPVLLESTPNMYAISYTGGAVGASDYKIRGFDYKRVGVYVNGIPLNDPEDRFTYFYDLPDFASNVADIQVQRGVGNSLYGDATFGGSINIASAGLDQTRRIGVSTGYGRYTADDELTAAMRRQTVEYSSGLIDGHWSLAGRYSKLYSGGYRDHGWYDGWSYYLSLSRLDNNMTTTVNLYGGPMQAALAFDGIDRATEMADRRTNWTWYENEKDDFNQPHYELHNTYRINDKISVKNTLYYIRGKGFYEQYKDDRDIYEYNIPPEALIDPGLTEVDLVRQKWVAKNQYGWNPRLDIDHSRGTASLGGSFYYFDAEHWGQVIWAENLNNRLDPRHRYYEYFGTKYSASIYALDYYSLTDKIRLMGNLQLRYLKYDFDQTRLGALPGYRYDIDWVFLSPRAGITYLPNDRTDIYFSFAAASREPADVTIYDAEEVGAFPSLAVDNIVETASGDTVYYFGDPLIDPERVYNFELGGNVRGDSYRIGVNLFWMEFYNEIVPGNGIDDDGRPRITNADRSVHSGIEFDGALRPHRYLELSANAAYNYNRLKDFVIENDNDWDGQVDEIVDYSGNPTAGFPEYLANLTADFDCNPVRLTYHLRSVGKQYIENGNNDSLSIGDYMVSSLSGSFSIGRFSGLGRLTITGTVNNLFNAKYEQGGYSYLYDGVMAGEYYPAAERNFYFELKWELE